MCKRNTKDPLVRILLDRYNLNLLYIPREGARVGDLYVGDGKRTSTPGSITYFLDPPLEIPEVNTGEIMADVIGQVSDSVSVSLGLGIMEGFLFAMGAGGMVTKVHTSYEAKQTKTLKFHYTQPTRDWVDAMLLGSILPDHQIKEGHALYAEGYCYYLVTAVVRSPSFSVIAESENATAVDIDIEALKAAGLSTGVLVTGSNAGEVTFTGKKKIAFGVELYELKYDIKRSQLRLLLTDFIQLRAGGQQTSPAKPAFIGDPRGNAFIEVD